MRKQKSDDTRATKVNTTSATREQITELVMLRARVLHEHLTDGDIEEFDDKLAQLLWDMHARGVLLDAMCSIASHYASSRYLNFEAMRRHILCEFRAEYRWEWVAEPDTSYDNLVAIAEYINALDALVARGASMGLLTLDRHDYDIAIDGVEYEPERIFDSVVPHLMSARRNNEGSTRVDYAI